MAVFGKMTKEELKELMGMDPEELKTALAKKGVSEEDFATFKTSQETTLNELKDSLAALTNKITELAGTRGGNTGGGNGTGVNNGGGNNGGGNELPLPSVLEDEDAAIMGRINKALGPIANLAVESKAELAYSNFKAAHSDFGVLEKDIKEIWDKLPLRNKINASQTIEEVYYAVKGRKVTQDGNKVLFTVESGANGGNPNNTGGNNGKKPEELLTAEELKAAANWGMTPEQYAKTKGTMRYA